MHFHAIRWMGMFAQDTDLRSAIVTLMALPKDDILAVLEPQSREVIQPIPDGLSRSAGRSEQLL
jgi:hypothetical protein